MISLSNSSFVEDIEKMCRVKKIDYIDAVVHWCEVNKVEIESVASIIKKDPVFKSKIQQEAENLNILKSGAKLPI
jgi:hypothetical protein